MKISRLLASAIGIQCIAVAGCCILPGFVAAFLPDLPSSHLDLPNHFMPFWLALAAIGALLVFFALERRRAKTVILSVAAASLVAGGLPMAAEYAARARVDLASGRPADTDLRILQFNVFGGNPLPIRARTLLKNTPIDVATLQEPHPELMTAPELQAAFPYRTPCVGKVCLMAIWSKRPITDWGYDRIAIANTQPRISIDILWADVMAPDGRPVRVMTTHYAWPWPAKFQRPQRAQMREHLKRFDKRELILTGDFNAAPWSVAMRRQDRRFRPLTRRTRAVYTWPTVIPRIFRSTRWTFLPIDHVYAGPAWRTIQVKRLGRAASDHYPVLVTLRREPEDR